MKKSDTEAERVARAELEEKIGKQIAEWAIAAERRGSSRISWPARLGRFLRNIAGTSWSKSEQAGKILQPQEESTELRLAALAYVLELYNELSAENVAPTLGTWSGNMNLPCWRYASGVGSASSSVPSE